MQDQLHLSGPFVPRAPDTIPQETQPGESAGGAKAHSHPTPHRQSVTDQANLDQQIGAHYLPFPTLSPIAQSPCTAGRLAKHLDNWKVITQDPWVLQTVQGYKILFQRPPYQWRARETKVSNKRQAKFMEKAVEGLIQKGAVAQVQPEADQFISTFFLVEKESGSEEFRPVINLCPLNRFAQTESFRMESLQIAKNLIQPGDFLMKLDLKDAYYTVPVHQEHRRYLCFRYQGTLYEFCCLPFGLSSAPRAFTKLLKPVATLLRSVGIRIVIYLDDILLLHQDQEELGKIFDKVLELLQNLGLTIKQEKCSSAPTQSLVFLGVS